MKIAYLSYAAIPSRMANSVHVMKMCASLGKLGHDVALYAPDRAADCEPGVRDPFDFYGIDRLFRIIKLPWPEIRFRSIFYALAIFRAVPRNRPDLIYSRYLFGNAILAIRGYRSVFETHSPVWEESAFQGLLLRLLCAWGRVTSIVTISDSLRRAYVSRGFRPTGGTILARDAADFRSQDGGRSPIPARSERLQVGYVGQLYPGKGMEVIAAIAPRMPEVDFHVVGGYEKDIEKWRRSISGANVHFHGFVNPAEVGGYLKALDVCLLPNQTVVKTVSSRGSDTNIAQYTSPLKMFEYMAQGKAIVCSRLPVLQEVLDDSMAQFATPDDPEEWIKAINAFQDPIMRSEFGGNARRAYQANHTWEVRAEKILNDVEGFPVA